MFMCLHLLQSATWAAALLMALQYARRSLSQDGGSRSGPCIPQSQNGQIRISTCVRSESDNRVSVACLDHADGLSGVQMHATSLQLLQCTAAVGPEDTVLSHRAPHAHSAILASIAVISVIPESAVLGQLCT
jgi:hypothetical protein